MSVPPAVRPRLIAVLCLAVLGISSSAVLVRGMEAGPLAIATWRCALAALLLAPTVGARPAGRDLGWMAVGGAFLGLHFATWFASLQHTTVLRSTVLVTLVPVWTGLLEWGLWGQRPPGRFWVGIAFALAGIGWMSAEEGGAAGGLGDALALVGGALWAVYLLVGRSVRARVDVGAYMAVVSASAALCTGLLALLTADPLTGFPPSTWLLIALATLGPQLLGHQGFAYAVRWLPAATVAALSLLEPVGATLLAALLLDEVPSARAALGGLLVVVGVLVALGRR